jgi:hypothetical protein
MRITRVTRPTCEADSVWQVTQNRIAQALSEFEETYGVTDTLILEEVNADQTQKTIVRAWPTLEIAEKWIEAMTEIGVTSAEVDPE